MMEYKDGKETGRSIKVLVTYMLEEYAGLEEGYCIMATSIQTETYVDCGEVKEGEQK